MTRESKSETSSVYRERIREALRALVLTPSGGIAWFGVPQSKIRQAVYREWPEESRRAYLVSAIQTLLYRDFYCAGRAVASSSSRVAPPMVSVLEFKHTLEQANCGSGSWQSGWSVDRNLGDRLKVQGAALAMWLRPCDIRCVADGNELAPETSVQVRLPNGTQSAMPGHYLAFGDQPLEIAGAPLVRLYFNLNLAGAVCAMREITLALNQAGTPFQFKVPSNPEDYARCDAGVLYVRQTDYDTVRGCLPAWWTRLSAYLDRTTPAMTRELAPGIGLAEEPDDGESFGMSRCRLIAAGVVAANRRIDDAAPAKSLTVSLDRQMRCVEECFQQRMLDLDRPYLNSNPRREYPELDRRISLCLSAADGFRAPRGGSGDYLVTAVGIADQLVRNSLHSNGSCTWLTAQVDDGRAGAKLEVTSQTLKADLYAGTAGIAMFLAGLARVTHENRFQPIARAAMRHALSHTDELIAHKRLGLYTGVAGVALAAASIGAINCDRDLTARAKSLLRGLRQQLPDTAGAFDLLSGSAGIVCALLAIARLLGVASYVSDAVFLGDELIRVATRSRRGWSWGNPAASAGTRHLTGLSHGTAGVGAALLALFQATGLDRFRAAAQASFEYERSWYDAEQGNWPHLDGTTGASRQVNAALPFVSHWCHGAPGIALSRLRAWQILGDVKCKEEAKIALETTAAQIRAWLAGPNSGNYSLCHGLAGNAAVLLYGSAVLGDDAPGHDLAREVADRGIHTHGGENGRWPCGSGAGEHPGLMLGLAGIGEFYLRLSHGQMPALLLPELELPEAESLNTGMHEKVRTDRRTLFGGTPLRVKGELTT